MTQAEVYGRTETTEGALGRYLVFKKPRGSSGGFPEACDEGFGRKNYERIII
jgi:hypothetical protein